MTVPIIGLAGLAKSGKDTAAAALVEDGWERRAFADKLREFLLDLNPIILPSGVRLKDMVRSYGWDTAKNTIPEVRELMQKTGVKLRRVLGDNIWVDAALVDLDGVVNGLVVTDVRFPNEVQAILDRGGRVFRIERPGVVPIQRADGTVHESETALDHMTLPRIVNDTTPEDLHALVRQLASDAVGV